MPSKHHRWSLDNFTVADIDPLSGLITAHTYGSTIVTVVDLRLTGHEQTSTIHVVNPLSLALYLSPLPVKGTGALVSRHRPLVTSDSPWQVVTGHKYVVQALSFSRESGTQPLLLTKVWCSFTGSCSFMFTNGYINTYSSGCVSRTFSNKLIVATRVLLVAMSRGILLGWNI